MDEIPIRIHRAHIGWVAELFDQGLFHSRYFHGDSVEDVWSRAWLAWKSEVEANNG